MYGEAWNVTWKKVEDVKIEPGRIYRVEIVFPIPILGDILAKVSAVINELLSWLWERFGLHIYHAYSYKNRLYIEFYAPEESRGFSSTSAKLSSVARSILNTLKYYLKWIIPGSIVIGGLYMAKETVHEIGQTGEKLKIPLTLLAAALLAAFAGPIIIEYLKSRGVEKDVGKG